MMPENRVRCLLLSTIVWLGASCHKSSAPPPSHSANENALFREVAEEVGLKFHHCTGGTGDYYFPEIMGAGVALVDYDGDGDLDVYLVQGDFLDKSKDVNDAVVPLPPDWRPGNRLFRNELTSEGRLHFIDVTDQAGVGYVGCGMGTAVGDYDNDGFADLYVTNYGHNVLFHNNGDGTFTDVTHETSTDDARWSTSAAFVDYDHDGCLDLFVTNYVDFTVKGNKKCFNAASERDYCGPTAYEPVSARLFRNLGNGQFEDATLKTGVGAALGAGLGVGCADFNGDGLVDILVANDASANHLWLNHGNGTFADVAVVTGAAFNADGRPLANMGVAVGDFDNDGSEDIFITHLDREGAVLYRQDGKGNFYDAAAQLGLHQPTFPFTGFGTEWFDYDNDGLLDLFVANGAVFRLESQRGKPYPFYQTNQLFHNDGDGKAFQETTAIAGPALRLLGVGRGAAFGDIDNDGDIDIVVTNNNGPVRLLLNDTDKRHHWLEVSLRGTKSNRMGLGARIAVLRPNEKPLWRRCHTDGSYLSASDSRTHFGLGTDAEVEAIEVRWPDGSKQTWYPVHADRTLILREDGQQTSTGPAQEP